MTPPGHRSNRLDKAEARYGGKPFSERICWGLFSSGSPQKTASRRSPLNPTSMMQPGSKQEHI
jgi:hypothetical protein